MDWQKGAGSRQLVFRGRAGLGPPSRSGTFKTELLGYTDTTVNKMKVIWQKYKVWLLIWLFYAAYYAIKSLIKLKSIDVEAARSGSYH